MPSYADIWIDYLVSKHALFLKLIGKSGKGPVDIVISSLVCSSGRHQSASGG